MSMQVSGSANQPHYDDVIKIAKEAVMNLGDKQVSIKKGIRAGLSNITSVFSKQSAKSETKAPAASTPNRETLENVLQQSNKAKQEIIVKIQTLSSNRSDESINLAEELIKKLSQLNGYITTLKNHLSNATSETAPLTERHTINAGSKTTTGDRISQTFSNLKNVSGRLAEKVKSKAEAIKSALTPPIADDPTGARINFKNDTANFSKALQNAYKLRDTVAGGESTVLEKAIKAAEKYQSSQFRSPIKADSANPKTLEKASSQLTALTTELEHKTNAIQNLKNDHKEAVSAFTTAYKEAKEMQGKAQDSQVLKNALTEADLILLYTKPETEKMGLTDLKNSITALTEVTSALTQGITPAKKSTDQFSQQVESSIDQVVAKVVPNGENKEKHSAEMTKQLKSIAGKVGVTSEKRTLFLEKLNKVTDQDSFKEFIESYTTKNQPQ